MKISSSEITSYKDYMDRRKFIKNCGITALLTSLSPNSFAKHEIGENSYNNLLNNEDSLNTMLCCLNVLIPIIKSGSSFKILSKKIFKSFGESCKSESILIM